MSSPEQQAAPVKTSGGKKLPMIILSVIAIVLTLTIQMSFLFLVIFILPSFVVYIVDRSPRRHLFKTVLACNLAGIIPFISDLLAQGNSSQATWTLVRDPIVWLKIYGMAGLGWVIVAAAPYIAQFIIIMGSRNRVLYLEATQRRLIEEWGPEIQKRAGTENKAKKEEA